MDLFTLGTKLYDCRRKINYRCVLVFMVRSMMHHGESKALQEFLQQTEMRKRFFAAHPQVFAQLTRQFFFRNSRAAERLTAITQTFQVMERSFSDKALEYLYLDEQKPLHLWEMPYGEEHTLSLEMFFRNGEIREGSMTLALCLDGEFVYHINFWCAQEGEKQVLYIGCHQGSKHGLEVNKELTKAFFGYRPKNFILYALRILAKELAVDELRAVSNYGFYANNHIRKNRKLLVSYDKFWKECGGEIMADQRFFTRPLIEPRKTMEEVPTRKRAVYRKRFAFLDALEEDLQKTLQKNFR